MYTVQQVWVLWNSIYSCNFSVRNGVEKRDIISPILFCVYFADLQSADCSEWVWTITVSHFFVEALAYADELLLLSPSCQCPAINDCCAAWIYIVYMASVA
jgi:hypothetical protein